MCWLLTAVGAVMFIAGAILIVRFFVGKGANLPEVAETGRVETIIVGGALAAIGPLLFFLGLTGTICRRLGIS
ncbi:MAG: hypothetical protein R6W77_15410 [Trueperaceae bacterium]